MSTIKTGESGFTILEVVIALMILGVGLMSAAAMQTRAVEGTNSANRLTERVAVAEEWIEDLMSRPIRTGEGLVPDTLFTDPDMNDGTWQDGPAPCTSRPLQTQYRATAGYPLENLTTIGITVTPSGVSGEQKEKKRITFSYIRSTRWN